MAPIFVTLFTIILQILTYYNFFNKTLMKNSSWLFSSFQHVNCIHLYFDVASYFLKGKYLEMKYGSRNFLILQALLILMSHMIYILFAPFLLLFNQKVWFDNRGFSGVLLALKLLVYKEQPEINVQLGPLNIPFRHATWMELIAMYILLPNSLLMVHLAGLLAGFLYTSTFVGRSIDNFVITVTGKRIFHARRLRR